MILMSREKHMNFNVGTISVGFNVSITILHEFERISIEEKYKETFESHGIKI